MANEEYKYTQAEIRRDLEADYFARCLLMPEKMIRKKFDELRKERKYTLQDLVKLISKKFDVEEVHVTLRLKELKFI